jgi:hypothetical protein
VSEVSPVFLFLSGDLLFGSRLQSAAQQQGIELLLARSLDAFSVQHGTVPIELVIVDLANWGGPVDSIAASIRDHLSRSTPIVAFGPHVEPDRLSRALASGCDEVMTRGEFHRRIPEVLAKYAVKNGS